MRILIATHINIFPADSGGAVRIVSIADCLEKLGHQVILLSGDDPLPCKKCIAGEWWGFKKFGQVGYFVNPYFYSVYLKILTKNIDLVIASCPFQSFMIFPAAQKRGVPVVYDAHNVEADRFPFLKKFLKASVVRKSERYLVRNAKAVLCVSEEDKRLFYKYYGVNAQLLPNGVDVKKFIPDTPDPMLISKYGLCGKKVISYFGSYDYPPNIEALRYLLKIWPEITKRFPETRMMIIGRYPPDWATSHPGVIVTGSVDDIVAYIRLANIIVVPLQHGGGTRLKILEALACGQTILSTPFGATGIAPDQNQKALILSEMNDFYHKLCGLLESPPEPCLNMISREIALRNDWCSLVTGIDWSRLSGRERRVKP